MGKILIEQGTVVTVNDTQQVFSPGYVLVEADRIAAVGEGAAPEALRAGVETVIDASLMAVMPGMVELGEDIFLKPVRKGVPTYSGPLHDMVANPRSATVMGLLEEARLARARGHKAQAQPGSIKSMFGRAKDWIVGNF